MVYLWFISEYTGVRPRWLLLGLLGLTSGLLVANIVEPRSVQLSDIAGRDHVHLAWGELIARR